MQQHFNKLFSTVFFLLVFFAAAAQQDKFSWRLGVSTGAASYYGDLSDQFRLIQPTPQTVDFFKDFSFQNYGLTLESSLSKAWGIGLSYNKGEFTANDRAINWKSELQTANANFKRSLNSQTSVETYGLYFSWYSDNGKLLSKKALLAPYLKAGIGVTKFAVNGDLYFGANENQRYYYWSDGIIRNAPQGSTEAGIVEQDGLFETNLTNLKTEGNSYSTSVFTPSLGAGLKFRIASRLNLNLEYLFHFTQTDYLDDVSGKFLTSYDNAAQAYAADPANIQREYRGRQDGANDFYTYASASLHYNFGRKKTAFVAPAIMIGSIVPQLPMVDTLVPKITVQPDTVAIISPTKPAVAQAGQVVTKVDSVVAKTEPVAVAEVSKVDSTLVLVKPLEVTPSDSGAVAVVTKEETKITTPVDSAVAIVPTPADTNVIVVTDTMLVVKKENNGLVDTLKTTTPIVVTTPKPATTEADSLRLQLKIISDQLARLQNMPEAKQGAPTDTLMSAKVSNLEQQLAQIEARQEVMKDQVSEEVTANLRIETARLEQQIAELKQNQKPTTIIIRDTMVSDQNAELKAMQNEIQILKAQLNQKGKTPKDDAELAALRARVNQYEAALNAKNSAPNGAGYQEMKRALEELKAEVRQVPVQPQIITVPVPVNDNAEKDEQIDALQKQIAALSESMEALKQQQAKDTLPVQPESPGQPNPQIAALQAQVAALLAQQQAESQQQAREEAERKKAEDLKQAAANARLLEEAAKMKAEAVALQKEQEAIRAREAAAALETETLKAAIRDQEKHTVYFSVGSQTLGEDQKNKLQTTLSLLRQYPRLRVFLEGFTDKSGTPQKNIELSKLRSQAVNQYLISQGVSPERISFGTGGIDYNVVVPAEGRRVELTLLIGK